jgi:MoaA/NifB/PqqE/SkfB family radical SAM enzyme
LKVLTKNNIKFGLNTAGYLLFKRRLPLSVTFQATNRCNMRCSYCGCYKRPESELSTRELLSLIDQFSELGTIKLGFTGGEPLLRPDIGQLFEFAKSRGMVTHVITNGFHLAEIDLKSFINVDFIFITIDGDEKIQEIIKGRTFYNSFDSFMKIKRSGLNACIATTITKHNINFIPELLKFTKEQNTQIIFSLLHKHDYSSENVMDLAPQEQDLRQAIQYIYQKKKQGIKIANSYSYLKFAADVHTVKRPACFAGDLYCVVDYNGDLYPCWPAIGSYKPVNIIQEKVKSGFSKLSTFHCNGCNFSCHQELNFLLSLDPFAVLNVLKNLASIKKRSLLPYK